MQEGDLKYWLAFTRLPNIGPARLQRITKYFSDLTTAWQASGSEYIAAGIEPKIAATLNHEKTLINPDELLAELDQHNISAVHIKNKDYPSTLKQIYDPPSVLYYKGKLNQDQTILAVVGTRKISNYGIQVVKDIIPQLVGQHITTISGLALGVDALVHQTTIEAGGQTIAVLGGGLDEQNLYPSANRHLANKILAADGVIISEYPPGTLPLKQHFPKRNRLISGWARGVLIIEGNIDSGSLITARSALEQNREVMAIPGSIYAAGSAGPNSLIKLGAAMVSEVEDILNCLNLQLINQSQSSPAFIPDDKEEAKILKIMTREPVELDELIRQSKLPAATVTSKLSVLEIQGLVKNVRHNSFVKTA